MSVSMWSYRPEVCDGGGCPGDCDLCDKPKNMEDEPDDNIMSNFVDALYYLNERGKMREAYERGSEIYLTLCAKDEKGEEIRLCFGQAPSTLVEEILTYD